MANPFQLQSRRRKLIYAGLILGLLTVSLMHRKFLIEPLATSLQLREQVQGEPDLTSSTVQLTLLGSRGFATAVLWSAAIEKQKKHQWNELELLVHSITKVQPHFISPWLFQSWNLAFNVSVECDRTRDKYFYVSRGIQLLAEGERRNQGTQDEIVTLTGERVRFPGNPDMRHHLGFFYQLKIGTSDEKHAMRCLLDLSCIDPLERNPARFWAVGPRGARVVNLERFEEFCLRNPRLVRRLRDELARERPQEVIAFLEDNYDLPSRFEAPEGEAGGAQTQSTLKPPRDQFPILPPHERLTTLPDTTQREFLVSFDVFEASRCWYLYAQEPLPPPVRDPDATPPFDPVLNRLPRMALVIFRSYPARARVYIAENLQEEGWFDKDGWAIRHWFKEVRKGQTRPLPRVVVVGYEPKYHSGLAWGRAYEAYQAYGAANGLYLSAREKRQLEDRASLYRQTYRARKGDLPSELTPEQRRLAGGRLGESFDAHKRLRGAEYASHLINYDAYLSQTAVESSPEAVYTRKLLFEAEQEAEQGAKASALALYEKALPRLLELLLANTGYRAVSDIQEDAYLHQKRYMDLLQDQRRFRLRPLLQGVSQLGLVRTGLSPVVNLPVLELDENQKKLITPLKWPQGPLEMIFVYEVPEPERTQLQYYLLGLTEGAQVATAPLAGHWHQLVLGDVREGLEAERQGSAAATHTSLPLTSYLRNRVLVVWNPWRDGGVGAWRPLLYPENVAAVRDRYQMSRPQAARPGQPGQPPTQRPPQ